MNWIIPAVLAQAVVSVANFTDKLLIDRYIKHAAIVVLFTGSVGLITGFVIFILRGFPVLTLPQMGIMAVAGIFLELYLLPYFAALESDDTSRVVPLFQAIPVFVLLFSFVLLGERLLPKQYIGFFLIVGSSLYLSSTSLGKTLRIRPAFWQMMLSSALYAISAVLFKLVAVPENVWDAIAYESIGIGIGTFLIALWPGYSKQFARAIGKTSSYGWIALGTSETFYVAYRYLFNIAIALGPVTLVNVASGFQPVFLLVYGLILTHSFPKLIRESIDVKTLRKKAFSIGVMLVGLLFIYL